MLNQKSKWMLIALFVFFSFGCVSQNKNTLIQHKEEYSKEYLKQNSKQDLKENQENPALINRHAIYIANHGWHTGFIIKANAIQSQLFQLKERFGETDFIEFGWGDKGFYQTNEITTKLTLQAMFWSSGSVIHHGKRI